jgi:hypothetical protein
MSAASPSSTRWLFGPLPDLVLGCGLGYAGVFAAMALVGPDFVRAFPLWVLPFLLLVTGSPHYGATLLRVYEQRESRRRYAVFSVGVTALLAAAFVAALHFHPLGSLLLTVYFNWNPWHYAGQNYGLAVMFLRRREIPLPTLAKRLLYFSFVLSFALAFIEMNGVIPGALYAPQLQQTGPKAIGPAFEFISLGIPAGVQRPVGLLALALYALTTGGALALLLRAASARDLLPAAALIGTQSLWFVIPASTRLWGTFSGVLPLTTANYTYTFLWIAVGHAVQYLWVTTYYAKRSEGFTGTPRYLAKCILVGAAIWNIPLLVFGPGALGTVGFSDGLYLLIASVVNLQHFVLDGAIWKLRDSRVASVLLRGPAASEATPGPRAAPGRPILKPLILGAGVVGFAVAVVGNWEREMGLNRAGRSGDYARLVRAARLLAWVGQDESSVQRTLGQLAVRGGDPDRAFAAFDRSLSMRRHPRTYLEVGNLHASRGEWEQAVAAYEAAYAIDAYPVVLVDRLAAALLADDRPERAREVLLEGLRNHRRSAALRARLRDADAALAAAGDRAIH